MASTQIQLVNRVLKRLREDSVVASSDNDYAELIAEFVSDAYSEVAEAHDWETLKHTVTVDITSGQVKYDLTRTVASGGDVRNGTARTAKVGSRLSFLDKDPEIYVYDDDSTSEENGIIYVSPEAFRRVKSTDRNDTDADPTYITIYPDIDSTTSRLYAEVYPEPTAARVIEIRFWTIPDTLESDGTTDTDEILVPERPVYHLALLYAYNERGEEIGEPGNLAERRYVNSLSGAIHDDIFAYNKVDRYDWRRD